jgi:carbonic anhydrase
VSRTKSAKTWVQETLSEAAPEAQIKACEQRAILESLANLMTFACIRQRVERGELSLHGWYFDIAAGDLLCFNPQTGAFEVVTS